MTTTARQDLTITITARFDGFDTEVCFSGQLDQLPAITKRIRELGGEPTAPHTAPLGGDTPRRIAAERVEPIYQPDGTACCPVHKKPLSEGQYGLFCSAKAQPGDTQNSKGYCALRFKD
jgi:hypothetical protein